jgi:hypothetical protein
MPKPARPQDLLFDAVALIVAAAGEQRERRHASANRCTSDAVSGGLMRILLSHSFCTC